MLYDLEIFVKSQGVYDVIKRDDFYALGEPHS